jgi:hypothetical protein
MESFLSRGKTPVAILSNSFYLLEQIRPRTFGPLLLFLMINTWFELKKSNLIFQAFMRKGYA